eukprot:CAMPEP_0115040914 /NCGR_PEP_ID=MMETSP0216-20121206/45192_1 /TAXON_ID=223996 /ORGANISM="Protocruzia adherens, Strain Boccale" /LENGTH=58 /DNA_ID=CAMNT_0002422405 /DNA_START=22 /DNA_END=198 /DNA_ORIENTATION=+
MDNLKQGELAGLIPLPGKISYPKKPANDETRKITVRLWAQPDFAVRGDPTKICADTSE